MLKAWRGKYYMYMYVGFNGNLKIGYYLATSPLPSLIYVIRFLSRNDEFRF